MQDEVVSLEGGISGRDNGEYHAAETARADSSTPSLTFHPSPPPAEYVFKLALYSADSF